MGQHWPNITSLMLFCITGQMLLGITDLIALSLSLLSCLSFCPSSGHGERASEHSWENVSTGGPQLGQIHERARLLKRTHNHTRITFMVCGFFFSPGFSGSRAYFSVPNNKPLQKIVLVCSALLPPRGHRWYCRPVITREILDGA